MTINDPTAAMGPTNPFHIARAYGVRPVQPVERAVTTPVQPVQPVSRGSDSAAQRDPNIARLVAGVVPGGVSFEADGAARPAGAPLPFYRHPAEKNAAATAVSIGRSLDVNG